MIGLTGCALLLVNMMMTAARSHRYSRITRRVVFLIAFALTFVPVKGLAVAGYLRGVTGDLSVTTMVLLVAASISRLFDADMYDSRSFFVLMLLVLGGGIFLYPLALGLTYFDPYSLGYGSRTLVALLFLLSLVAWYFELYLIVVCFTLAASAYMIGIYESRNLWDYLIDPLITFYAVFWLAAHEFKRRFRSSSSGTRSALARGGPVS